MSRLSDSLATPGHLASVTATIERSQYGYALDIQRAARLTGRPTSALR